MALCPTHQTGLDVGGRSKQSNKREAKTTSHQRSPDSDTNNKGNREHDMTGRVVAGSGGGGGVGEGEGGRGSKKEKEKNNKTHRREPTLDLTESGRFAS